MMDYLGDLLHTFIPNEGNDYKPHFFRVKAITALATAIIVLSFGAYGLQTFILVNHDYLAAVIASALVDLANGDRTLNGLAVLSTNPILERAAQLKANDMATKGYFAHTSPEGTTPWHWFKEAGYSFSYAGENLAVRFTDSIDVQRAWMNSPTHRANITNGQFTEIGIATAEGMYQGQNVIFVVQEFGRPAVPTPASVTAVTTGTTTLPVTTTIPSATTSPPVTQGTTATPIAVLITEPQPTSASTSIAGSSFEELALEPVVNTNIIVEDPMFIAVREQPQPVVPVAAVSASNAMISLFQKIITSPRTLLNTIYVVLGGIIGIALALFIGIEVKKQFPYHVFLGVFLIVLMASLLFLWQLASPGVLAII